MDCPVCHRVFKEPKTLHCGHTLCARCSWVLTELCVERCHMLIRVPCPLCRQTTSLKDAFLSTNYALKELAENNNPKAEPKCWKCGEKKCDAKSCERKEPITIETNLPTDQEVKVLEVALEAISEANDINEVVETIEEHFEQIGEWCCVASGPEAGQSSFSAATDTSYIWFRVQQVHVLLYEMAAQQQPCWKCGSKTCEPESCKADEPQVVDSFMSESMTNDALRVGLEAVKTTNRIGEISTKLINHFNDKYGPWWNCGVWQKTTLGANRWSLNVEESNGRFIVFEIANLYVCLFKGAKDLNKKKIRERKTLKKFLLKSFAP